MLTVEHTKLRRKNGVIEVIPLCGVSPVRARAIAEIALEIVRAHEGAPRAELEEALDALPLEQPLDGTAAHKPSASDQRFVRGIKKLALDACDFDVDADVPPAELRAEVFAAAARARLAGTFVREDVLAHIASSRAIAVERIEAALFADLSTAHTVKAFDIGDAGEMVDRYRLGELQAMLLRATKVVAELTASPAELRTVLRAAKLHQLLFDVEVLDANAREAAVGSVRLTIEGPMGLFQQSTRYGLKLAVLLPHLLACRRHHLEATVRVRKHGALEKCVIRGGRADGADGATGAPVLGDVAQALLEDLRALADKGGPWQPSIANEVLTLPGQGALVPDLQLAHALTGQVVFVEVLGFCSRAAVWRRVELVERGLPYRVVFCASERLRVSEEALPPDAGGALIVFKGALKAAKVLAAIERVAR